MKIGITRQKYGHYEQALTDNSSTSPEMKKLIAQYPEKFTGEILRAVPAQTPEQEAAKRQADIVRLKSLKKAAAPLIQWIRENYGSYTEVLVSWDSASVMQEGDSVSLPYSEE